jgi:hypothetical protein
MTDQDRYEDAPEDASRMIPESRYLGAWDLDGKTWVLLVRDVKWATLAKNAAVSKGGKKMLVFFSNGKGVPIEKGLLCGSKNTKALIGMYGKKWRGWVGKPVAVYPTTDRGGSGDQVDCVRIKREVPQKPAGDAPPNVPMDQEMRAKQMKAAGELPPQREPGED